MAENKILKAYCDKSKKYYGVVLQKFTSWEAVDFIPIEQEDAKLITSAQGLGQTKFKTHENLLACKKCGGRRVCGCSCPTSGNCSTDGGYRFQCIYCSNLKIDYSLPTAVEGRREGDVITLSQGQVVKLTFADNRPLTSIRVGLGWDPIYGSHSMDIDSTVFVAGGQGEFEKVYFANLNHPSGCVVHHGDNLTGRGDGDDEYIDVDLNKVPANRDKLIFVINIYKSGSRGQDLSMAKNMHINLRNGAEGAKLFEYNKASQTERHPAMVLGVAFRSGTGWSFKAIGKSCDAASVNELAPIAINMVK